MNKRSQYCERRAEESCAAHLELVKAELNNPALRNGTMWVILRISALARFDNELNGRSA